MLLLLFALQVGSISGIVSDAEFRQPLPGATVFVRPGLAGEVTDDEGQFRFVGLPAGRYQLEVRYLGYEPALRTEVEVRPGRETHLTIALAGALLTTEELVVTASAFHREMDAPTALAVFDTEAVRTGAGSSGDPLRLLSGLPGVARTDDMRNALAVRGGSPMENRYLVDGIPIPNINHFPTQGSSGGAISIIGPDLIESISFRAGGMGASHHDRLSSELSIELADPSQTAALLDFSLAGAGFVAEHTAGNMGVLVAARRSWLDLLVNSFLAEQADAIPTYSDIVAKGTWSSGRDRVTILGLGALDESGIDRPTAVDQGENQFGGADYRSMTLGSSWVRLMASGYTSSTVSWSRLVQDLDIRRTVDNMPLSVERWAESYWTWSSAYTGKASRGLFTVGGDANWSSGAGGRGRWGAHSTVTLGVTSTTEIEIGGRADRYPSTWVLQPRVSVVRKSGPGRLWVAAGRYAQDLPSNLDSWPMEAVHLSAGGSRVVGAGLLFTVEAYSKRYRNLPRDPDSDAFFLDEIFDAGLSLPLWPDAATLAHDGRARSRGVELSARKAQVARFSGLAAIGWSRSEFLSGGGGWFSRRFDSRLSGTLDGQWRLNARHSISARWALASGQPHTPIDQAASLEAGFGVRDNERLMGVRLPPYHSLSLRFDVRRPVRDRYLHAYLSVWNVYSRRNPGGEYWDDSAGVLRERRQWGLLPVLGLKLEL